MFNSYHKSITLSADISNCIDDTHVILVAIVMKSVPPFPSSLLPSAAVAPLSYEPSSPVSPPNDAPGLMKNKLT